MINIVNSEEITSVIRKYKKRRSDAGLEVGGSVRLIIENVIKNGDKALQEYTRKFDGVNIDQFLVTEDEIEEAMAQTPEELIEVMKESKKNIEDYHLKQKKNGYLFQKDKGIFMGQRIIPLEKVGIYVPGGKAAYPSSVLMNAVPAKVAGVQQIIMVTPPNKQGKVNCNILAAAKIAGVDKIYKAGGAQAIAALAYGTDTIPKVDKIVGPGNAYVAEAKKQVFGQVGIDMMAGPSEILIMSDEQSNARYIAADLMSQSEHDERASAILLTTSKEKAAEVVKELEVQMASLEKRDIIEKSLTDYGYIVICSSIEEEKAIANIFAPEHLEILLNNPMEHLADIKNAASVFLGEFTPEPIGDYFGGTNHVLPTGGTARFSSPLSVDDFIKKSSYLHYSKEAFYRDNSKIEKFAQAEGLTAHANSIIVRSK